MIVTIALKWLHKILTQKKIVFMAISWVNVVSEREDTGDTLRFKIFKTVGKFDISNLQYRNESIVQVEITKRRLCG